MTDTRQTGNDCQPSKNPAGQPNPPGKNCTDPPTSEPPTLDPPAKCPPTSCECPSPPSASSNCLEEQIDKQTKAVTTGEKAKDYKTELVALLAKAKAAMQDYTRDKYTKLTKQWADQDRDIVELIRKLVCAAPCWKCVIECYVCPLLNDMHYAEAWLYGDGTRYDKVYNLYDLRYWHDRDVEEKQRKADRIKLVLAAWEKPGTTLEKALNDEKGLIADITKSMGTDLAKAIYDVFFRLVPMHLAIAPPKGSTWTTGISEDYTIFCECDEPEPDDCCGPDVGEWSLRQRLIYPVPYLIDPNDYIGLICCLVEHRYQPAQTALAEAKAALQTVDDKIARYKKLLEDGLKSFEKDAKGAIPSTIECCPDEKTKIKSQTAQQSATAR